jgi:hypothetical protein
VWEWRNSIGIAPVYLSFIIGGGRPKAQPPPRYPSRSGGVCTFSQCGEVRFHLIATPVWQPREKKVREHIDK